MSSLMPEQTEETWKRDMASEQLKKMAKAVGKVVAATDYLGDPNPTLFSAWRDSIESLMQVYDIPKGPAQVQAAAWFLKGRAYEWWAGMKASKRYVELSTLEQFFDALQMQFQPLDAAEQCIEKWCGLRQTKDLTTYMDEVDRLHHTWGLCEKAEFGLALRGLKRELKGVVRRAMAEQQRQWLSLRDLRTLARSAELEKLDHVRIERTRGYPIYPQTKAAVVPKQQQPVYVGAVEVRDRGKVTHDREGVYRCGVCNLRGHRTQMCRLKKASGCWRCGGTHFISRCTAPYVVSVSSGTSPVPRTKGEDSKALTEQHHSREQYLGMMLGSTVSTKPVTLTYPINVGPKLRKVIATLDTGAQCSAIREDVASEVGLQWTKTEPHREVKGVSGDLLQVEGSAWLRIQGAGITTRTEVWVIKGILPQLILGLPWIMKEKVQVDWGDAGTLIFPNGEKWQATDATARMFATNSCQAAWMGMTIAHLQDDEEQERKAPEWLTKEINCYQEIFKPLSGIPPEDRVRHVIRLTPGAKPVMKRPYRLSTAQRQDAEAQIRSGIQEGWIQPSSSAWGTAILMVPKKDGTWRMCVDYRDLNALTVPDAYPLPRIDDMLHRLGRATYFTKLDLQSGYHQIWMEPEDREKTAFRVNDPVDGHCHFEWRVMPFGLKNAPPTFQRYMTLIMNPCADCCLVYMDDLLVYSET